MSSRASETVWRAARWVTFDIEKGLMIELWNWFFAFLAKLVSTLQKAEHMKTRILTNRSSSGFTLIELLIVVAIIGLIAAIAIPNMLSALDKARQKRTMADIRVVGEALEVYHLDNSIYPKVGEGYAYDLVGFLTPYISQLIPLKDGWGKNVIYQDADGVGYTVMSLGSNFVEDPPYVYGPTMRFRDDIIVSRGVFIQWPDGPQMP